MARLTTVEKARTSPGNCGKCGKEIQKGDKYLWWQPFRSSKRLRCGACPRPRPSETATNEKLAKCLEAGESIEDAINEFNKNYDIEDLRSAVESAAETVREAAEMYRESAQNIEDGFQHSTSQSDEYNEKADNLESKADEIESAANSLEEFDEEGAKTEAEEEAKEGGKDGPTAEEILKDKKESWAEEQAQNVEEFTDISPD
jgi:methyl-accepting chemotaxis protein